MNTLNVSSSVFENEGSIPTKYTCDGQDISPPLGWTGVPDEAESLVLIVDDPDAPGGTFVHWVIYNIPPHVESLPEAVPSVQTLENGARQGGNDFGSLGYGGPCPPGGTHRYYFKLYALDAELDLPPGASKSELMNAMEDHVIAEGQLMGTYARE